VLKNIEEKHHSEIGFNSAVNEPSEHEDRSTPAVAPVFFLFLAIEDDYDIYSK
jgi:hypothetical protein